MTPFHPKFVYTTLLTRDSYLPGVLVLNHGLRSVNSKYPLLVMISSTLSKESQNILRRTDGILVHYVKNLQPTYAGPLKLEKRFEDTWTKLRVWELVEFERVVLLDSDMIVRRNMDELLDKLDLHPGEIAASHVCACNPRRIPHYPKDWAPQNCAHSAVRHPTSPPPQAKADSPRPYRQLNAGLVVLSPSQDTFDRIYEHLNEPVAQTYRFPDQDLITAVFQHNWKPLPWYYNALRTLRNVHPQLWSDDAVRCLHYIFADKPWHSRRMVDHKEFSTVNRWWWDMYDEMEKELQKKNPEAMIFLSKHVNCHPEWQP